MSDAKYGEEKTVSFTISSGIGDNNSLAGIRRNIKQHANLSRWEDKGYFTSWLKLEERIGITGVSLKIGNDNGNYRLFEELYNLQIDEPDLIKVDDEYPDLLFPNNKDGVDRWEDFKLVKNWNYLLWRADKGHFYDSGNVDLGNISWFEIIISLDNKFVEQNINVANIRVQDGLQKTSNPTNGSWYAPNSAPQYGIFDTDETFEDSKDFKLRLLNFRQDQYPSNGDHTRILSKKVMPLNFSMQIYFKLIDLPRKWEGNVFNYTSLRKNTYIRVQYDFDTEYDPGHDWFGTFISLEYDKLGLVTTYPIIRYFKQGQEPTGFTRETRIPFQAKDNTLYILNIKALGQYEKATIYEADRDCIKKAGEVEYTFKRQRYGLDKRYPLSVEATGNVHSDIYSIEVISLDNK